MNDNESAVVKVFISHKAKDKEAAMKIDELLQTAGGRNLKTFLSERIEPGVVWTPEILGKLERANWLILLYTDPSEEWDWCLFEAGFFAGGGKEKRLVCLHAKGVTQPTPLQPWESVRVNDNKEMDKFLSDLLEDLNPALFKSEEKRVELRTKIQIAFLDTRTRDSEWNTSFIILNFKNKAQVDKLEATGRVPNDVSWGEEQRESLDIFGHRGKGLWTVKTIQDKLPGYYKSWWMKSLGRTLKAAVLKEYPIPLIPSIYSPHIQKEYYVVLHRIDRFSDGTVSFCLLFIERVPELVEQKDKQLTLVADILRLGRLFRWKVLTKYHRDLSILRAQGVEGQRIQDCLEDVSLSMEWIRGEAQRMDVMTHEDIVKLFEGEDDKKAALKLLRASWPEVFQRLSKATEDKDLDGVLDALNEMLELNRDFMIRLADRYSKLWKEVS